MKLIWKILIPLLITVISIDGILVYQNIKSRLDALDEKRIVEMESNYKNIVTFMKKQEDKLLTVAIQMASTNEIQKTFAQNDRKGLLDLIKPGYDQMTEKNLISSISFFKIPATSFLIPHMMKNFNKDVSAFRPGVVAVETENKFKTGIESGKMALALRAIVPISYRGKLIGTLDVYRRLDNLLLEELRNIIPGDFSIYVPEKMQKMMNQVKLSTKAPQGFLAYSSLAKNLLAINSNIYQAVFNKKKELIVEVTDQEHTYDVLIAPIFDIQGNVIALIEMRQIKDNLLEQINESRNMGLIFGLIILVVATLVVWTIVLRFITKPIGHLVEVADAISYGDFSQEIKVSTKDEIGELALSIERMRVSLKGAIERLRKRK